ncbi:MAG TPA: hypothetical protein VF391_12025 [Dermatophilaceae bacterium]
MGDQQEQSARVRAGYNVLSRSYRGDTADEATQRQYAGGWVSSAIGSPRAVTCSIWGAATAYQLRE